MEHATILKPEVPGIEIAPISDCRLRVGVVSYLNTKPLVFGLKALAPNLRVEVAPPSRLAHELRRERVDVALVPVMEYFSRSDYGLISESAICGHGKVRSVVLYSRLPIDRVRSICLDPESMTSNALLKVLCRERFAIKPHWTTRPPRVSPTDAVDMGWCDAELVIGNNALAMKDCFRYEYDLGQEWWRQTGLPFVFAAWAVRPGTETGELALVLREALRLGLENLEWIAADAARTLGLDRDLCLTYLQQRIRYRLNEPAWKGMARFFEVCAGMDMISNNPPPDIARRL